MIANGMPTDCSDGHGWRIDYHETHETHEMNKEVEPRMNAKGREYRISEN
jgi:hypothetical protein